MKTKGLQQPVVLVVFIASLVVVGLVGLVGIASLLVRTSPASTDFEYRTFASCEELADRLTTTYYYQTPVPFLDVVLEDAGDSLATASGDGARDEESKNYSTTNVQVEGVDELDVLKVDGQHMYSVDGSKVVIADISDPGSLEVVATLDDFVDQPQGLFLTEDKLAVMTSGYTYSVRSAWYGGGSNVTSILVYDISDPASPELQRTLSYDGNYQAARLVDNNLYIVSNYYTNYYDGAEGEIEDYLPRFANVPTDELTEESFELMAECNQISYFGNKGTVFTTVLAVDLEDVSTAHPEVLVGNTETLYMSQRNVYLATTKYDEPDIPETCDPVFQALGMCDTVVDDISAVSSETETEVVKFELEGTDVGYVGVGVVPGTLLNQFSLDEHSGFLRIATTSDGSRLGSLNNLYVLDRDMSQVGEVEGLARGEEIYSVRFMGDTAYVVTFERIDPLFVIDLSDPAEPEVLGELKIPGFSDYLHPYDENHILGFGKDADEDSGMVIEEGVKVALFDVEDPTNPVEVGSLILGGRGSSSELLDDHKALLFDKSEDLLVMPATLRSDDDYYYYEDEADFSGFVILDVDLDEGVSERKRLSDGNESQYYYYFYSNSRRSFYVGDYLYTLSDGVVRSYDLGDYNLQDELEF